MAPSKTIPKPKAEKYVYSVWALPTEDVCNWMKKLMSGRLEFEPHITFVETISLIVGDALKKVRLTCKGLKAYNATIDCVDTGNFFY